ncbi:MAG: hypothetical protein R2881_01975 [Eubacteriales bacterium]
MNWRQFRAHVALSTVEALFNRCDELGLLVFEELPAGSISAATHGRKTPFPRWRR